MNTTEDFIILQGHVYTNIINKNLTIGLSKPAKLKNSRYILNTPHIGTLLVINYKIIAKKLMERVMRWR